MKKNQLDQLDELGLFNLPITLWNGREFVSRGKTYIDFANTNYLGFDFDPTLHKRGSDMVQRWGNIAGWSRMEADPYIYNELEQRLSKLLGCQRVHLLSTITIMNFSIIPTIAKKGVIFTDEKVHTVVWEACRLARDHGAQIVRFRHQDVGHLKELLEAHKDVHPKLIAVDGVYSISTELAPVLEMQELCEKYEAWLYIDDAHGFGVLGENPTSENPYGVKGNGIVAHVGGNYKRTFYVSSFGKAFCTATSFATIPDDYKENLRANSLSYLYSAPVSPYTIGTVEAALDLNEERGDQERQKIRELVQYFMKGLEELGYRYLNNKLQPVVYIYAGNLDQLVPMARQCWEAGIVAGLRAYPVVPMHECRIRFALSSLHSKEQLDHVSRFFASFRTGKSASSRLGNIG